METLEGKEREKRTEAVFDKIVAENFSKLMSDAKPQIQEAQRTTSKINAKKPLSPRNIIFKLQKTGK